MNIATVTGAQAAQLKAGMDIPRDATVAVLWENPGAPCRIITEVWVNAGDERPAKRYIWPAAPKALFFSQALEFAAMLDSPFTRQTIVPANEAEGEALRMEIERPSAEFLATGRIRYSNEKGA